MTASRIVSNVPWTSTPEMVYKGKITNRSWQQLPPEIIRLIATQYLMEVSSTNYCPQIWDARENWHPRIVYTVLRDANEVEKLMRVCPSWAGALETHLFWHQACTVIDPHDTLAHHAIQRPAATPHNPHTSSAPASSQAQPTRITPFKHFRNMTNCTCFVCRINSPQNSNGLATAKRTLPTPYLGPIPVCRDHRKNSFCGLCLREAPPFESENEYNVVGCVENEDEESWPGVDATCRACRSEWLWRRVSGNSRDREAVGGHKWNSPDWETRQAVEAFIEMGEGTIADVVGLAQEKHWLRKNTKLGDMLSQALAASRYTSREEGAGVGYGSAEEDLDLSEDEDAEDEDDPELMSLTEDAGGVRELAISDWARNRILDGHWFSPADQWYGYTVPNRPPIARAVHPCPWNRDATYTAVLLEGEEEPETDAEGEVVHPRPSTIRADVPPSFQLCEQAYIAFQKQMRSILLPAMINVVRRVVIECGADGMDPAMRAARMDVEDVVLELREEAVWYNGIDWLERRANGRREGEERKRREADAKRKAEKEERKDGDGDDSSASSKSDGSHTTSPVLSTTTLQTTPSPPPSDDKKDGELGGTVQPVTIPVSPVLESPVLLHPIPYVPVTVSHLPHYSMEAFKMVWREACAPLYHCRCKICERAMVKANGGSNSNNKPTTSPRQVEVPSNIQIPVAPVPTPTKPVEIKLDEVHDLEGEEEMEEEEEAAAEEIEEEEEEEGSEDDVEAVPRLNVKYGPTARKRRSEELDEDAEGELDPEAEDRGSARVGTPPKRARRGEPMAQSNIPGRSKKRSSEELDGEDEVSSKRMRVKGVSSDSEVSPPTSAMTGESDSLPSAEDIDEDRDTPTGRPTLRPRRYSYSRRSKPRSGVVAPGRGPPPIVSEADLDQLCAFEAEVDV